jgi:crotonobetainyl-CoA:carnitine CoA-transferase CaiB-like acyl-CoA transferase
MAPHNTYPCAGDDRWVVISVPDDAAWARLATLIARPAWATDERFVDCVARKCNEDEIDRAISEWTRTREVAEVFVTVQAERVPCAPVANGRDMLLDPQMQAHGAFERLRHTPPLEDMGVRIYPASPWHLSKCPARTGVQAPTLGQHSGELFASVLGLSPADIAQLRADGITGTEPAFASFRHDNTANRRNMGVTGGGAAIPGQDVNYRQLLGLDEPTPGADDSRETGGAKE